MLFRSGENGWTKVTGDDVGELHFHYYPSTPIDDIDSLGGLGKKEAEEREAAMET